MLPTAHEDDAGFRGTAIACSGGGIRAAAFSLGGLQRLRLTRRGRTTSLYDGADRVYGVSGGGYIATALHMARKHSDGDPEVQTCSARLPGGGLAAPPLEVPAALRVAQLRACSRCSTASR